MSTMRLAAVVGLAATLLAPGLATAQLPSCEALPTLAPLAGNPAVFSATAVQQTTGNPPRAYCMVNVVWRDPALRGSAAGYADPYPAVDSYQHIRAGIALPLNSNAGDAAWGGRLIMTAGGGAQGSVPGLTGMIQMNPAAIGAGTDSGHGTADSGSGDSWGVIQGERLNLGKVEDWSGGRSNSVAVRLAKQLAQTYYGRAVQRTYWNGFSGGGHMGWAQIQNFAEEYDGALIGAPAHHWQKFRLADAWGSVVRKKVSQQTSAITTAQNNAVNATMIAACDLLDGVADGFLGDPRECTWSAHNNVCGQPNAPAAPNCLDEIQAAGIDRAWDGPRNSHGKRIWHAYDRGANQGGAGTNTPGSTTQVLRWTMFDNTFAGSNLYEDQESIDLAAAAGVDVSKAVTYEDAALLVSQRTADYTDVDFPEKLRAAHGKGIKIIVYHGTADAAIHWRNDLDFYTRVAAHFARGTPDFDALHDWYRFFMIPGLGHNAQNFVSELINWVENGVAPDRLVRTTGFRVLCPFPQRAIYVGPQGGSTTDPNNFVCDGDLQTKEKICMGLRTPYKEETSDELQAYGRYNPAACNANSKVPIGKGR